MKDVLIGAAGAMGVILAAWFVLATAAPLAWAWFNFLMRVLS